MTPFRLATSSLLLVLGAAAAFGQDQPAGDNPMAPDRAELTIRTGTPVTLDGTASEGEWDDAQYFELERANEVWARAAMKREGRYLLVHVASTTSPWGFGFKLVFADPRGSGRCTALVAPLNPPHPPLTIFRDVSDAPSEWIRAGDADLRMHFREEGGFEFEIKLPLDRLGFPRDDRRYNFAAEVWDLSADQAVAVYPLATAGPLAGRDSARLIPDPDWGADVPLPEQPPAPQAALELLEDITAEERGQGFEGAPAPRLIEAYLGTEDGRRRDAPLAEIEKRLRDLVERYPDYVSLRASLVRVLAGRNDNEGALQQLVEIEKHFPMLADDVPHVIAKVQLLVGAGRYDDAIAALDFIPGFVDHVPGAKVMRASIVMLKYHEGLEAQMRAHDAERDDLPRVRIVTGRGSFVVELYEDDAPNAVANFVSLCESGFYDGTRFHWVERGGRVVGGDPNSRNEDPDDDGFGHPGYRIESEVGRRLHTAGSIAFVDQRRRARSEGCIFTVHLSPFPQLDGRNTVLGRVIEGMDVVFALEYGDAIVRTEILRKRDHPYEPVKRALDDW